MKKNTIPKFLINAFYESKFSDNLFIVKAGGKIVEDDTALDSLIRDIRDLTLHGIKIILVYGGGHALDEAAAARGVPVEKRDGRRVTSAASMGIMKEIVGGALSLRLYQSMARNNLEGLTFNAVPPGWMNVELRPKAPVDFGFVGDIHAVHARPIRRLLKTADFIAVPCLAWAQDAQTLCNINADTIATELAIGTQADKLIFLSDVDGVHIGGQTAFIITAEEIPAHIQSGAVTGGMKVKLENCKRAMEAGVRRIHLINGLREDALRKEIYEPVGPGTMLMQESERASYMTEIETQKLIEG
ncbi:MAG: hypothetical protein K9G62_00170 [Alphaproteobacteria bacterium]|nr:hypothetical protein [Alphaproteobacteria bacterium]